MNVAHRPPCTTVALLRRGLAAVLGAVLLLAAVAPTAASASPVGTYLVQADDAGAAAAAVHATGGTVTGRVDLFGTVTARLSDADAARLQAQGFAVVPDVTARPTGAAFTPDQDDVAFQALTPGAKWEPTAGEGVAVALVDTGVADLPAFAGRLTHGVDLSDEGDGVDRYGHGTFMAGLIAAQDDAHHGVAPGADIVSVKVAGRDGSTTLSSLLEGIAWVVEHADEHGIRVLNLSFAADIPVGWAADPLSAAVEAAWASGIVVVAASGNGGDAKLPSPGRDPWIVTAGATDPMGTADPADDIVPDWSGRGRTGPVTKPEITAPGVDVVSLRVPGSTVDEAYPGARIGSDHFRGSGTSMAAALASGAAAVLLWAHPEATPDDVKGALVDTARAPLSSVDLGAAIDAEARVDWWQLHPSARGHEEAGPVDRMPWFEEADPNHARWSHARWSHARWSHARWSHARWSQEDWAHARWSHARWSHARWSHSRWSGARWSGARWSGARWSGARWSGARWSGARWSGARWSEADWAGARWSGARWSGARWSGARWSGARWSGDVWAGAESPS